MTWNQRRIGDGVTDDLRRFRHRLNRRRSRDQEGIEQFLLVYIISMHSKIEGCLHTLPTCLKVLRTSDISWLADSAYPVYNPKTLPLLTLTNGRTPQPRDSVLKISMGTSRGR